MMKFRNSFCECLFCETKTIDITLVHNISYGIRSWIV